MATKTQPAGISWQWRINLDGYRRATDPDQRIHLVVTNRRTRGGWGPYRWWAYGPNGQLATGEVYQPGRYASLVRQAMWEAEQWAGQHRSWATGAPGACDDCYRSDGTHDYSVEH